MATGRVQYVLTGDATALAASLEDIKKRNEQLEASLERMQRKQKQTADEGATAFKEMAVAVGGVVGVASVLSDTMEALRSRTKSVLEEMGRASQAGDKFQNDFAKIMSGSAGLTDPGASSKLVLDMARNSALGSNAPQMMADALQAISRSGYSDSMNRGILQQTSSLLQLSPGANAGNLARGVSALVDSGMNPQQAANMMLGMPGAVTSLEDRAKLVDELQPFAAGAGMDMTRTLGLAGYVSNVLSDESGGQTANVIKVLYDKLVTNRTAAEGNLGVQLGGDLIQNLRIAGGSPNLMSMMDEGAFGLGKGPASRLALQNLFSADGLQGLEASLFAASAATRGNRAEDALGRLRSSVPSFSASERRGREFAALAVDRIEDTEGQEMSTDMQILSERLQQSGATTDRIDIAKKMYMANRRRGLNGRNAMIGALKNSGVGDIPVASYVSNVALDLDPYMMDDRPRPARTNLNEGEAQGQVVNELKKITENTRGRVTRERPIENIHHN